MPEDIKNPHISKHDWRKMDPRHVPISEHIEMHISVCQLGAMTLVRPLH